MTQTAPLHSVPAELKPELRALRQLVEFAARAALAVHFHQIVAGRGGPRP